MKRLLALSLFLLPLAVQAQISTDRPGFGTSPATVGRSTVQVELGVPEATRRTFAVSRKASITAYAFPALLRIGTSDRFEVRVGTSLYDLTVIDDGGSTRSSADVGFDLVSLGGKLRLTEPAARTQLALVPEMIVPTQGGFRPLLGLTFALDHALSDALSLGGSYGATASTRDIDTLSGMLASSLTYRFNDAVAGYAETALQATPGRNPAYAGAGLTLLLHPDAQLDAFVDFGVNDAAADVLFGLGASFRF